METSRCIRRLLEQKEHGKRNGGGEQIAGPGAECAASENLGSMAMSMDRNYKSRAGLSLSSRPMLLLKELTQRSKRPAHAFRPESRERRPESDKAF